MLKRKIYDKLLRWKQDRQGETALLINGARRVGKSYICKVFAQNEYKSYILIDFSKLPTDIKESFLNDVNNFDLLFNKLQLTYETPLFRRESLIIFDEVQLFPAARQLIKHLVADGRYDYIETGSLISIKRNIQDILIPSEEESINMYPLDFEEFLWAMGNSTTSILREFFETLQPLGAAVHRKMMDAFRQYLLIGGMPQVVDAYVRNKDFAECDNFKKNILSLYRNDITKFAIGYEHKVLSIYDAIPAQLSKKEKKYVISSLNKDARLRTYEDAFVWLYESMIINPCFNSTDPKVGLSLSSDYSTRKLYFGDTGLLVTHTFRDNDYMSNSLYKSLLFDKLSVNEGMIMENIVAQMLRANGHNLYFYSRVDGNNRKNHMEIDFLIRRDNKICPVEVKSSAYRAHTSLDKFRTKFKNLGTSYILYSKDIMVHEGVVHIPLYMAMFL